MQTTIENAEQGQAKAAKVRTPILICNEENKANDYLRKITRFKNESAKFKTVFEEIARENLSITYSKEWLKAAVSGTFVSRIDNERDAFIQNQPKLMHKAILEEWYRISAPLFNAVSSVLSVFEDLQYESVLMGRVHPAELTSFDSMPIDEQGNFNLSDDWIATTKKVFEVWVNTEDQFNKHDLVQDLDTMKVKFREVYGESAGYYWTQLTQNFRPTTGEFLTHCIK